MSVIAAFLWNKSPRPSISTMIFDDEAMQFLSEPKINYFPESYLRFRKSSKWVIKEFFLQIQHIKTTYHKNVIIEFKIVFHARDIPYIIPAKESLFVYKSFHYFLIKFKRKIKTIKVKPQLRQKLSGNDLKQFKQALRSLYLVSRKRNTSFEYHLWTVALHATPSTYEKKLLLLRKKLLDKMWSSS